MPIYIDPSEQRSSSLFPSNISAIPVTGIEAKFGCDFILSPSQLPPILDLISPTDGSLFVQVKFGWDIASFEQRNRAIARMREAGIPPKQRVLLSIGRYERNGLGQLSINGSTSTNNVSYTDYTQLDRLWIERGGIVSNLPDKDYLADWIEGQYKAITKAKSEGDKIIYRNPTDMILEDEAGFQIVEEVPADDLRSILCRGLPNFGSKLAQNVIDTMAENKFEPNLINALIILTTLDSQKKNPLWKVAGISANRIKQLRTLLYLDNDDWFLGIRYPRVSQAKHDDYVAGWMAALENVATEFNNGERNPKVILSNVKEMMEGWEGE